MASTKGQRVAYQQPRQRAPAGPTSISDWQIGDIAFLKWADAFNESERSELLESRRVPTGATGHPVIVLARSNDSRYYIVTTVSAYSSDEFNNYRPPWKQTAHMRKDVDGFRAFEGSARPNNKYPPLRLADKKQWPKIETSWVYIHNPCVVLSTTLIRYTKSRCQLRMEPESLKDLVGHMEAKSWKYRQQQAEIAAKRTPDEPAEAMAKRTPTQPAQRSPQQTWQRDNKENVRGPVTSQANAAPKAATKPLYSAMAALSISTTSRPEGSNGQNGPVVVGSKTATAYRPPHLRDKGQSCHRNPFAVLT